jgi:hypothetical protein
VAVVLVELGAGGGNDLRREMNPEVVEQADEIAAPSGRDRGGAEGVLENQVPADDPGDEFAQSCVAVGVGRTTNGNHRSEFGIAERGEGAGDAGDDEAKGYGGPGIVRGGRADEHEDAGADDGPDAKGDEIDRAQRALEGAFAFFTCFGAEGFKRLGCEQFSHESGDPSLNEICGPAFAGRHTTRAPRRRMPGQVPCGL